ncbi:serine/threonine-protein kinase, partial [Rubrivirga sp.]|uniref:serine/threonine-protein kinase n=1 Tax=Rubrivirga sp. TaxID=1885344 RepID=UPI003C728308
MSDRWQLLERLFSEAVDLAPDERAAYLEDACRTDGAPDRGLREEVERMLALDAQAGGLFEGVVAGGLPAPVERAVPSQVGRWRIRGRVGEGGMGEVFEAVRADGTYQRRAAIKLVRPGLAPDVLTRFRAERHLLARLDHPAIARLLDGGTAGDGRPYLALEFVDGVPITDYADRRRLGLEARLRLFAQVCDAVAYAHRQLVVHRDLKPSNVLVSVEEGRPVVKLLDFGIARLA